jgi:hypothetical protein
MKDKIGRRVNRKEKQDKCLYIHIHHMTRKWGSTEKGYKIRLIFLHLNRILRIMQQTTICYIVLGIAYKK